MINSLNETQPSRCVLNGFVLNVMAKSYAHFDTPIINILVLAFIEYVRILQL